MDAAEAEVQLCVCLCIISSLKATREDMTEHKSVTHCSACEVLECTQMNKLILLFLKVAILFKRHLAVMIDF